MTEVSNAVRAAALIAEKTDLKPIVGMVLGSGLGSFADSVEDAVRFSFADLPGFPVSTVSSHKGELVMGAGVDFLALTPELGFDTDAWCAALAKGPKLAMLANPSNPVGCMFDSAAFQRLLQATPASTLLVVDEAYVEYARLAPGFPDALAQLREHAGPWIVLRTFSKAWGLAGLRVGYGLASDEAMIALLERVRTPFHVNLAAQLAARAAWGDEPFMRHAVAQSVAERETLATELRALGLRVAPSATNFLFVDLGRPNPPVNEALLARGVIIKPWREPGFETFIRVSIGSPADNSRLLATLREILAGA